MTSYSINNVGTKDRLRMGDGDLMCVLCSMAHETHSHLFFQCNFVREVWSSIRAWLHINRRITTLRSGLKWIKKDVQGTLWVSRARRLAFHSMVYIIWTSRNKVFKENTQLTPLGMMKLVQIHVYYCLNAKFPEFERRMELGIHSDI